MASPRCPQMLYAAANLFRRQPQARKIGGDDNVAGEAAVLRGLAIVGLGERAARGNNQCNRPTRISGVRYSGDESLH